MSTSRPSIGHSASRAALLLAAVLFTSQCTDRGVMDVPEPERPEPFAPALVVCTVDVAGGGRMQCAPSAGGAAAAAAVRAGVHPGVRASLMAAGDPLILGGQGINVLLENTGNDVVGNVFSTDVTVKNLIGQALGTADGATATAEGVRVFFVQGPTAVGGGTIALLETDGMDTFTASDQPYYEYPQKIDPNETSAARTWKFELNGGATGFTFAVYVWGGVQFPDGWVSVTPASDELNIADGGDLTTNLTAVVRDALGRPVAPAPAVTWGSSDELVATVTSGGVVTAHKSGSATITATAGVRTGTSAITVIQPADVDNSTVVAVPTSITADGASQSEITVTLRDALDNPLTMGGDAVTLELTGTGSLSAVTDEGDGTYTAVLTAPSSVGSGTVTAKLGVDEIGQVVVSYVAGTASQLTMETQPSSSVASGEEFAQQPAVRLRDATNNPVLLADVEVTASIATGAGTLSGTMMVLTDANGIATFTDLVITGTTGIRTLSFSADAVTAATSGDVDVTVGALDHFLVEAAGGGAIGTQTAGASFNVQVTARDGGNNTVTSFTGTVDFTSTPGGGITAGGTSGAFTAGVLSSHAVTMNGGDFTLTATRTGGTESGTSNAFQVQAAATAVNDAVAGASVPGDTWHTPLNTTLTITDGGAGDLLLNDNLGYPAATLTHFGAVQCNNGAGVLNAADGTVESNAAGATMSLAGVAGCGSGSLTVSANGSLSFVPPTNYTGLLVFSYRITNAKGTSDAVVTLATGIRPAATDDNYSAAHGTLIGNVSLNTATGTSFSVSANDGGDQRTVHFVSNTSGGAFNLNADGTFTYAPTAGFTGAAAFTYHVRNGFGNVLGSVSASVGAPRLWFTDLAVAVSGTGTQASPFRNLSDLAAANAGGGGTQPQDNDVLFIAENGSAYVGTLTLRAGQRLIGQDASATLASIAGLTPATHQTLPGMNPGANSVNLTSAGTTVTLNSGNTVRGLTLGSAPSFALGGATFGTLTIDTDVLVMNPTGGALGLNTGTIAGNFGGVASAGGAFNVALTNVAGTLTLPGPFSGATTTALHVSGGTVSLNVIGGVTHAGTNALLHVLGGHTGTLDFNAGALSATAGLGLQFDNADGTYNFNTASGSTNLSGGDAGIDILNNSGGTFTFGRSSSPGSFVINHVHATNQAFFASGSAPNVTYHGNITKNSGTGWMVDVFNQASGTITFANGTLTAGTGTSGITMNNADGAIAFNGTTGITGGRIAIIAGSSGAISFGSGTTVTNPSAGRALDIVNSSASANVTYGGTISTNNQGPVQINGVSGGTVDVTGSITSTGQGILITGNSGGTYTFSGTTKTFNTGTNAAISVLNSGGAAINFTGGNLDIDVTSGTGFNATGGGTVTVTGTNNTVNANAGGTAVNITSTIGGGGVTFARVDASGGGTNGIILSNTGGAFLVDGGGASDAANTTRGRTTARSGGGSLTLGAGGTITGKGGDGVVITSAGQVTLRNMVIQNNSGDGVQATSSPVSIDNSLISGHTNNSGVFFTSVSNPSITHSEITNNAFGAGAPAADIHNVRLISNTGTGTVQNSAIANTSAGAERQLQIFSTSGTLNITVSNTRIGGSTIGDGASVYAFGSSNITASFQNDSIHNNSSFGLDTGTETTQSATLNLTVNNTKFINNFLGVTVAHGSSGTNTFSITNNNFQTNVGSSSSAVNINRLGGGSFTGFGLFSGTVSGNIIGTSGVANSGSDAGDGITVKTNGNGGTTRVSILSNTIRRYGQHGIGITPRDATSGHTLHARIQNNNIAEGKAVVSLDGINVTMGALNTDVISLCLDIGGAGGANGNTVTSAVRNGIRVRSSGLPAANVTLTAPGYDGTGATYFANRNPAATGASGNTSFSNASGTTSAGNCTTP